MALGQFRDVTGARFGSVVALRKISPVGAKDATWEVRCDCGRLTAVRLTNLKRAKSCGCKRFAIRHGACRRGQKNHYLYGIWAAIIQRCTNPNCVSYKYYGGRGIKVCDSWADFLKFFEDVGERPSLEHSLDRLDNNGNYEPGNVRWATKEQQSINRRSGRLYAIIGRVSDVKALTEMCGSTEIAQRVRTYALRGIEAIYGIEIREV